MRKDILTINEENAKDILSLDWVQLYLRVNFSEKQIKSITPFTFTIGTNNHGEDLQNIYQIPNSMFYGKIQLDINPNGNLFEAENVTIKLNSYFNHRPFERHLNRVIEVQNWLNEQTERVELFDRIEIQNVSTSYDTYLSFIGFKLDYA